MKVRHLFLAAALPAALVLIGCGPSSPSGGTKSTATDEKGNTKTVDKSVKVIGPNAAEIRVIKQGEKKSFDFTLERGADLKADVALEVTSSSDKVKVVEAPKGVAAADKGEFKVTLEAAKDAALGDVTIKATAKPKEGPPASVDVTFKVLENK